MQDRIAPLITAVAARDRAAFSELYLLTSDVLFGVLIRMLRDRANAEDGLQEVFARVWTRADSFVPARGSGMTWLMTIARNYAIDQQRQRRAVVIEDVGIDTVIDPHRGADDMLAAQATVHRIVHCLGQLEPKHADCIRSAYLDGKSYADLAARHAVPINTMRTWLRRSLRKLRDCVAE
jgi:RNA polymerase sigma-70 factor (ECF subfamily)